MTSFRYIETLLGDARRFEQHIPVEIVRNQVESIRNIVGNDTLNLINDISIPADATLLQVTVSVQYLKIEEAA